MEDTLGKRYNIRMQPMICGKCGYDLRGLPERGGCPECGNTYDKNNFSGIAKPDNIYRKSEAVAFWLKILALVFGGMVVMGASGILSLFAQNSQSDYEPSSSKPLTSPIPATTSEASET